MRRKRYLSLILATMTLPLAAASLPTTAKPEEVGLSSERLGRIHEMIMRHIEAHGVMDLESKKPMAKDAVFRLASSTKPIAATAVLMLMEEGKLKLNDP